MSISSVASLIINPKEANFGWHEQRQGTFVMVDSHLLSSQFRGESTQKSSKCFRVCESGTIAVTFEVILLFHYSRVLL